MFAVLDGTKNCDESLDYASETKAYTAYVRSAGIISGTGVQ